MSKGTYIRLLHCRIFQIAVRGGEGGIKNFAGGGGFFYRVVGT